MCRLLLLISFLFSSIASAYQVAEPAPEYLKCARDSDCIWVAGDCCGFMRVISATYKQKWAEELKSNCPRPGQNLCPLVIDDGPRRDLPGCVTGTCKRNILENYSTRDVSFCQNLKRIEERSFCFWDVAIAKRAPALCSNIDDKNTFIQQNNKTSVQCFSEVQEKRIRTGPVNFEFCDSISDKFKNSLCLDNLATQKKDPNICLQMKSPDSRLRCASLSVSSNIGTEQCRPFMKQKTAEFMQMAHICMQKVAVVRKNPSDCDKLYENLDNPKQKYWIWFNCISFVAQEAKNPELCRKLSERISEADEYHREKDCRGQAMAPK